MPSYRKSKKENHRNIENFNDATFNKFFGVISIIMIVIGFYMIYQNYKFISSCDTLPSKGIHYFGGIFFGWLYFLAHKLGLIKCPPKIQNVGF